jgi:hypothetical protein
MLSSKSDKSSEEASEKLDKTGERGEGGYIMMFMKRSRSESHVRFKDSRLEMESESAVDSLSFCNMLVFDCGYCNYSYINLMQHLSML